MSAPNLNYNEAMLAVREGKIVDRPVWNECKVVRLHKESDCDFTNIDNWEGTIVEDCKQKKCDCAIGLYVPSPEDVVATDFYIVNQ